MTLKPAPPERTRRVGHITHAAQVRVNQRVEKILARRVALARARRAAQQLVERLKWAGEDAEDAERETAIRQPQMAPPRRNR